MDEKIKEALADFRKLLADVEKEAINPKSDLRNSLKFLKKSIVFYREFQNSLNSAEKHDLYVTSKLSEKLSDLEEESLSECLKQLDLSTQLRSSENGNKVIYIKYDPNRDKIPLSKERGDTGMIPLVEYCENFINELELLIYKKDL